MKPSYEELEAKCALQQSKLETINKLMGVVEMASDIAKAGVAELEARCAALAAENAVLNNKMDTLATWPGIEFYSSVWTFNNNDGDAALEFMCDTETPATDAFLAEVRAQGVEMFAKQKREEAQTLHSDTFALGSVVASLDMQANELEDFAAQLRQEAK